ncbi:MAG: DUF1236 domain-containing protein [Candidatus Acidiferrum sp.]
MKAPNDWPSHKLEFKTSRSETIGGARNLQKARYRLDHGFARGASRGPRTPAAGASVSAGVEDAELEADKLAFFRTHIRELQRESRPYANPVRRGEVLPPEYTLYVIPPIFGRPDVRYTVLNDHVVLVNPRSRMIIQVVD